MVWRGRPVRGKLRRVSLETSYRRERRSMTLDLTTTYLGLQLKNPLVASASPLSKKVDTLRRLEDAGAAAVVMYSLFEEQITHESQELNHYLGRGTYSFAESRDYFHVLDTYIIGPDLYLDKLHHDKQ